ncbi:MAG: P1 family peptidase [Terriglobales bacterium]
MRKSNFALALCAALALAGPVAAANCAAKAASAALPSRRRQPPSPPPKLQPAEIEGESGEIPQGGSLPANPAHRPRVRDWGIKIGVLPAGPLDALTDVAGVAVGQTTLIRGADVRTGVTAILPHPGNLFQQKVPGAVFVGNAFGKLMGSTQVNELGEIETPILLTSTLDVPRAADALLDYMLALPGNERVRSINPVVAETNDGYLSDIRARAVGRAEVFAALRGARGGPVAEGAVGAGTGTVCLGFKGGIGTASRRLPPRWGGWTVGVLVQTNFGGTLILDGAPVGRDLGREYLRPRATSRLPRAGYEPGAPASADGSVIVVLATDAPLSSRNLKRLAARAMAGIARTGSAFSNGSGDYAIAFSTATALRRAQAPGPGFLLAPSAPRVRNDAMSPLFEAAIEATQEAVYDSLFQAVDMTGNGHAVAALPLDRTRAILRRYRVLPAPAPSGP